ncbi:12192_t:CDS:2 [Ambispora leptoticha]|uniref:Mitochondrial import inner membrane translocase subunit TIM44 n=1 Tax=Ambispora leptoticha TaxID=144679 RepID=A0A9N9AMX5_9GLOM|nr:12192_t:CDS:2 [Ambispora leptoticha]
MTFRYMLKDFSAIMPRNNSSALLYTCTTTRIKPSFLSINPSSLLFTHNQQSSYLGSSHSIRGVSAFAKFVETFKTQLKKNKELQEDVKLLQDQAGSLSESETLKRAKQVYEKAKEGAGATTNIGSEAIKQSVSEIKKSAEKIGTTVSETLKEVGETPFVKQSTEKISDFAEKVSSTTEPIRQTKVYSTMRDTLKETVPDDSSRYGGFMDKETRRKAREEAFSGFANGGKNRRVREDPEAGSSVILHKDSAWKESWNKFKETNPLMQGIFSLKRNYEDSDNIVISYTRAITSRLSDTFSSFFEETEVAQTISLIKMVDPQFNLETFMKEARTYIIPEVMEAYLNGDVETLRIWCSEAAFNVMTQGFQAQQQQGLISDSKILDLRNLDLYGAKVLDNDIPVLLLQYNTQEIIVFRDRITKEIVYGKEDAVEQASYICALTIQEDRVTDPITNGWRVMDMAKSSSQKIW